MNKQMKISKLILRNKKFNNFFSNLIISNVAAIVIFLQSYEISENNKFLIAILTLVAVTIISTIINVSIENNIDELESRL